MRAYTRADQAMIQVALGRPVTPEQLLSLADHSLGSWCRSIWAALRLTRAFDRGGAHQAEQLLSRLPSKISPSASSLHDVQVLHARKDAMRLKAWLALLLGDRRCFASSFAICGGLRQLGYPCFVEVGYEYIHQYTQTPFHAYVVYEGEIVNDFPDMRASYVPFLWYGKKGEQP